MMSEMLFSSSDDPAYISQKAGDWKYYAIDFAPAKRFIKKKHLNRLGFRRNRWRI